MTAATKKALAQQEVQAWLAANRGWNKGLKFRSLFGAEELVAEAQAAWDPTLQPVTLAEVLSGKVC
jgi:hypothetical protein